jgi:hypothetical protein
VKALSARVSTRTGRSARRLVTVTVAAVTAIALLGGCGFSTRQQAAAIVNGQSINMADVSKTHQQLTDAKLDFSEPIVLTALIAAPLLQAAVAKSGSWKPDETYASVIATIPDATDTTKQFVEAVALIQSQKMTQADIAAYRQNLNDADISVNPRFGEVIKSNEGPVYFTLGQTTPKWVVPSTATATASPTPTE